ncbi:MAG TPA: GTP-binding protein [Dehalococcoidia bacterium]|nr:GTP-binding protein [Dehalococcoidia bacterium]
MKKVRFASIGGFYGVGKTTTIMELGKKVSQEGKQVAIISNDKGAINVDGEMIRRLGFEAEEITGGCICFYLDHLGYIIDTITERFVPDVLFIEPVAYFLPSNLYDAFEKKFGETVDLAPVIILVDAPRLLSYQGHVEELPFPESRQIEDAEVVVINKMDMVVPDQLPAIRTIIQHVNPRARLIMMSAKTGMGLDELSSVVLQGRHEFLPVVTMTVFKTFVRSLTEIGERGERYAIEVERSLSLSEVKDFLSHLLMGIAEKVTSLEGEINHIKAIISDENFFLKASLVSLYQEVDFAGDMENLSGGRLVVDAIASKLPEDVLYSMIIGAMQQVAPRYGVKIEERWGKSE